MNFSVIQWFNQGGLVMYPLLLLSIFGFALTLERFNSLKRRKLMPPELLNEIQSLWSHGAFTEVKVICERATSPLAKILKNTLEYPNLSRENMEITLEKNGQLQAQNLLRNLRFLGAIGSIAPMLGLLGTVFGMIKAFNVVAQGDPDLVSKAIAEALITTAAGLIIGILALISYYYFRGVAERFSLEMETFIQNLFNTRIPTGEG